MTKREFELTYGILRPYINEGIRMTKTKPVQEGEYWEIDLVKAVATCFQARRDRMLTRAKGWQRRTEDIVAKYRERSHE